MHAWEVGEMLGRSTRWVLDQAAAERIPSFKVGHAVRFDEQEILRWLEGCRRGERLAAPTLRAVGGKQ